MNSSGKSTDAIVAVLVLLSLIIPFAIFRAWVWFFFIFALGVFVALAEGVCIWLTGKSLSQNFWSWAQTHRKAKWVLAGLMLLLWMGLLAHLLWR